MKNFELLPHIADVRLKVTSDTLTGLFSAAVEGMSSIMKSSYNPAVEFGDLRNNISVSSLDESMLIIDFLSEVLTLMHKNKACYKITGIEILDNRKVSAELEGIRAGGFDEDIKAVTYTETKIIRNEMNIFETIIVFDI